MPLASARADAGRRRGGSSTALLALQQALERLTYEVSHLFGRYFAAKVGRAPPLVENLVDGAIDLVGQLGHAERASKHFGSRGDGAEGVGDAAPRNVGRRAVDGLVEARAIADARAGEQADGAGEHRGFVAQDVAEHVAVSTTSKLRRLADEVHRAGIDQRVPELDVGVALADLGDHVAPEA